MNAHRLADLRYLLQEDVYLLSADREVYLHRPEPQVTPPETPEIAFKYMGDYKNAFLILTHYPEHEHIEPSHLAALESTLKRIGLTPAEAGILNMAAHQAVNYETLTEHLKPKKLIILGTAALPGEAPFVTLNQPQQAGDIQVLYTFSFGEMMGHKENTKLFWNQIKQF